MELKPITRQEQIIAGKDLEPITRMERFLKDYGVSNYFGETTVMGDTLTWDSNTEGLEYVEAFMGYKVSDAVLTEENLLNASLLITDESGEHEPTGEMTISKPFEGVIMCDGLNGMEGEMLIIVINDVVAEQIAASAGTYFTLGNAGDTYVSSLTIPGYNGFETKTIKTIDPKYLPPIVSPSGKKFKLSVDDSGVLSATEV